MSSLPSRSMSPTAHPSLGLTIKERLENEMPPLSAAWTAKPRTGSQRIACRTQLVTRLVLCIGFSSSLYGFAIHGRASAAILSDRAALYNEPFSREPGQALGIGS